MKKAVENKQGWWRWLLPAILIWRGALFGIAYLSQFWIKLRPDFFSGGNGGWANFDGVHYLAIAEKGYGIYQQAFFPLYPRLIHFLSIILGGNLFLSGFLISNLSLIIACILFYKLIRLDYKDKICQRSLFYLLLFPSSFFLGSIYSESLFLVFLLGSFYAARRKSWLIAGILGGFASATRFVGVFIFPALLIEWWQEGQFDKKKLINLFWIFLSTGGLLFYMWYLIKTMGDPLSFIRVQPMFGANRTGAKLILLYQVFWRYLKMVFTTKMDVLYYTVWSELLVSILFLILSIVAYSKMRFSYFIFMILAYLTPTLTGTFLSMPRLVLALFPGFIILAIFSEKHSWFRILYPLISGILLIISTTLFIRGYWVA